MKLKRKLLLGIFCAFFINATTEASGYLAGDASIALKVPGNAAKTYSLSAQNPTGNVSQLIAKENIPVLISRQVTENKGISDIQVTITAREDIYFNYSQLVNTGYRHDDCLFYMPGFWYRKNLRSPEEAPSFHTSDSWIVREDRLSTPLTGIFNEKNGEYMTVIRIADYKSDALATHSQGEVILSGETSIGYTGFENINGQANLSFGFPFHEAPKTYIRKLTLAPEVQAFQYLKKGESITLTWQINTGTQKDFSQFVSRTWEYCYDTYLPQPVETPYTVEIMKDVLTHYFVSSFVGDKELKYTSGVHLRVDACLPTGIAEVGFIGRVLLNAFNAYEYGMEANRPELVEKSNQIYDSYLKHGFTREGLIREVVNFDERTEETNYSIRRQSEGAYALLLYLQYERQQGRKHPEWEQRVKTLLDSFLAVQKEDGSFPRKFKADLTVVDNSGGSTPSATVPLTMAYTYFKDKRYLESAKRSVSYLEENIISKADYFSSTLDANCEDKEASYYTATATYYLAQVSKGKERQHYASLCKQAAYFALSWYYVWDVPFAQGQMLGDIGLKTRGWGNVSVENNHIDVFIFEFASVLNWLAKEYNEARFSDFSTVISSSMRQLLPYERHLCGVAKTGYYPEVVQHTNWDYGKNGKGYYNDIFAPGWTVASLWEMFTPDRVEKFFNSKK